MLKIFVGILIGIGLVELYKLVEEWVTDDD